MSMKQTVTLEDFERRLKARKKLLATALSRAAAMRGKITDAEEASAIADGRVDLMNDAVLKAKLERDRFLRGKA